VVDDEHHLGRQAHVARVHQHRALLELVAVLLEHQVGHRLHQRVGRVQQAGHRRADAVKHADVLLLEADALVAAQHGVGIAAVAPGDLAVALADDGRDVGDLVAARFTRAQLAAQLLEGLGEERADEEGLQLAGLGLLHLLLDGEEALLVHHLFAQGVALDDVFEVAGCRARLRPCAAGGRGLRGRRRSGWLRSAGP
jgi:hypothetical protein